MSRSCIICKVSCRLRPTVHPDLKTGTRNRFNTLTNCNLNGNSKHNMKTYCRKVTKFFKPICKEDSGHLSLIAICNGFDFVLSTFKLV